MTPSHFSDIAVRFLSRRDLLRGAAAATLASPLAGLLTVPARAATPGPAFEELGRKAKNEPVHHVAPGYRADPLIAWGDPLVPGAPAFDPAAQSGEAQAKQFGLNCDFVGYVPLKDGAAGKDAHLASGESGHGLLCVNHEYPMAHLTFPGAEDSGAAFDAMTAEKAAVERAALGHSIVEIRREGGTWTVVKDSPLARRVHADTDIALSGPARGHKRLRTDADPSGETVRGTFANCSGGVTPWGTILSGEENFQDYFRGAPATLPAEFAREMESAAVFAMTGRGAWGKFDKRFDINATPHEFNRFGWVVEIDPYDPASMPKKRTALGRFRHEAATIVAKPGAPVVSYLGDDQPFQHIYKFVSSRPFMAGNAAANADILDEGTLYVARFADDGTGEWVPLVHGEGPLTTANGFEDQGDVLIDVRKAAKLIGATETDRPEDIETDPITSRTYVAFTGGVSDRKETGPASPRAPNLRGHIVEILAPGEDGNRDHAAAKFTWDILLMGGHPQAEASSKGRYGEGISDAGYFAMPDNLAFDPLGRLWIATDGSDEIGLADGLWACCVTGPERAVTRHFFSCPRGAEMCGPCFTPDGTTLFVSVQHPGQEKGSSFDNPSTRWPAGPDSTMPPRPAVVAITRDGGGVIGGG